MRGRLVDLSLTFTGKQRVTLELDDDFREEADKLKDCDLSVEIKKYRPKRSTNANSYFHVLVNMIAAEKMLGDDEVKSQLVIDYGSLARNEDGSAIGFKLPAKTDVSQFYPYARCYNTVEENGMLFNYYKVYKRTRTMDSKEMARLIDGAILEAKELGLDTMTPMELARLEGYAQ